MRLRVGLKKVALLGTITALLLAARPVMFTGALPSTMPNRYLKLSDSKISVSPVNYEIGFDTTLPGTLGSVEAEFCENDPFPGTACTVPNGFDISAAVLISQAGTNDFTVDVGASNAHKIVFSRVPSAVGALTFKFELSNVTNTNTLGSQYLRIRTFTGTGTGGSVTDSSGIAFVINGDLSVSTEVPPHLDLCVGVTISNIDCTNVVGDLMNMGTLKTDEVATATSHFVVGTNADNGYTVSISGNSLISGNNVLPALAALTVSVPGTKQFGLNLRQNNFPAVGAEVTAGSAAPVGNYAIPDNFIFVSGNTIATSPVAADFQRFTVSYIANIDSGQPAGYYATTINFVAVGNF